MTLFRTLALIALAVSLWALRAGAMDVLAGFTLDGKELRASQLPAGAVEVAGVRFVIGEGGLRRVPTDASEAVLLREWPGGAAATEVAVLHTHQGGTGLEDWRLATGLAHRMAGLPPDWPEVLRYELEYADGRKVAIPVRFGESIEQWHRVQTVAPMLWARRAWTRPYAEAADEVVAVYAMRIPNPRPSVPLRAVRALRGTDRRVRDGVTLVFDVQAVAEPVTGRVLVVQRRPLGDDANDGSFDRPFGSLHQAARAARPGDTVLVRGGVYALDAPVVLNFEGEANRWLTLSAFPGESPILDGWGVQYDPRLRPYGEDGPGPLGRLQHDTGVVHAMGNPSYLRIQGLHVRHSRRAGISAYGRSRSAGLDWGITQHVEVGFNTVYRCFSMGIITHFIDDLAVVGNRVIRPHSLSMATDPDEGRPVVFAELPQEGIDLSRNRRFVVAFNEVGGGGKEAIDLISVEDGEVHHNYVHSSLNGIYIDAWSVPIRRLKVYRNFIHNAFNGIPLSTEGSNNLEDFEIHHNIIVDSKSDGLHVGEATYKAKPARVAGHKLYQNTVDGSGAHAMAIGWQAAGIAVAGFEGNPQFREIDIYNNIVTRTSGQPLKNRYWKTGSERSILFSHNLVFPPVDSTPAHVRERRGYEAEASVRGEATVERDPLFRAPARGDFRIMENSPARRAGRGGEDVGALPFGSAWRPGLDWAGRTTAYYRGDLDWQPVTIPRQLFTVHRNHLRRPSWFQRGRYGADFQHLPSGEQSLAGITFEIPEDSAHSAPNVLVLAGFGTESAVPEIRAIPVGRTAAKLAFLHAYHVAARERTPVGTVMFSYRVHLADGSVEEIPVRLGMEIEDWQGTGQAADLPGARVAWTMPVLLKRGGEQELRLYAATWTNPRPATPVVAVDIVSAQPPASGAPAVFAISCGNP